MPRPVSSLLNQRNTVFDGAEACNQKALEVGSDVVEVRVDEITASVKQASKVSRHAEV